MLELYFSGVRVRVSLLFPAAMVVLLTLDQTGVPLWCVAASAMHEAGHFLALLLLGNKPSQISVGAFGIRVEQSPHSPLGYRANILVSLAGPVVNLFSFAVVYVTAGMGVPAIIHLTLAVFNLLPIEPLDGGQALFCFLALQMEEAQADHIVFIVSLCTIVPLAVVGFTLLIQSGYNFTLLLVSLYLSLLLLFKRKR